MKFSVVIPSFLGKYANSASNREIKIIRAIESVYAQTFQDFEIILVCDGCEKTFEIADKYYRSRGKLSCFWFEKQKFWSGVVRSAGIERSIGDWITYLDVDDFWQPGFLQSLTDHMGDYDWVYFNDFLVNKDFSFSETHIEVDKYTGTQWRAGTSNIAHKRSLPVAWRNNTYQHDQMFIKDLQACSSNYGRVPNPGYCVCHIPGKVDL